MANEHLPTVLAQMLAKYSPRIENRVYRNQQINIDGYHFSNCLFSNCEIITYKGTFTFEECFLNKCMIRCAGESQKVVKLVFHQLRKYDIEGLYPKISQDGAITIS